jgi:hypothetical protein
MRYVPRHVPLQAGFSILSAFPSLFIFSKNLLLKPVLDSKRVSRIHLNLHLKYFWGREELYELRTSCKLV